MSVTRSFGSGKLPVHGESLRRKIKKQSSGSGALGPLVGVVARKPFRESDIGQSWISYTQIV